MYINKLSFQFLGISFFSLPWFCRGQKNTLLLQKYFSWSWSFRDPNLERIPKAQSGSVFPDGATNFSQKHKSQFFQLGLNRKFSTCTGGVLSWKIRFFVACITILIVQKVSKVLFFVLSRHSI